MDNVVLSLCDRTSFMVQPWAAAGYTCICVDTQNKKRQHRYGKGMVIYDNTDVGNYRLRHTYRIVFAFPPCTDLASSGARWFREKGLSRLILSLQIVEACLNLCIASRAPWMLENPIGVLSSYWRAPDFKFDPCDYAGYLPSPDLEAYTKKTCLWVGNDFRIPQLVKGEFEPLFPSPGQSRAVKPELGSLMHSLGGREHGNIRSVTPRGFAEAVFRENEIRTFL